MSPTWVTTTAFSASIAAEVYLSITRRYQWTSIFMVLDAEAMPVFHSAAEALNGAFNDESGYQLTSVQIDCKNLTELLSNPQTIHQN